MMHGYRTPQHHNGDFHWFLRTRLFRVVAQIVIVALLLADAPVPTDYQAVAEATGSSSSQPRIMALSSCVARGGTLEIYVSGFNTTATTVTIGGVPTTIVRRVTERNSLKKLVVTVPQIALQDSPPSQ